ncbi:MAG TPA: hypothetical protein VM784_12950 [Actinomycetota bacterium]|nr:hypothetical protein [Actinomycetota bacterium]
MKIRLLVFLWWACAVAAACTGGDEPPSVDERLPAAPTRAVQERRPTSAGVRVSNEGLGPSGRRVATAVRDLKRVALWGPLTRDLFSLQLQTDPGSDGVPDDGHLADAMIGAVVESGGSGTHCSIRFYPAAIKQELATLEEGYRAGLFDPPPTARQLWAGVLAHELAHCRNWEGGEPYAERWEARALRAVSRAELE